MGYRPVERHPIARRRCQERAICRNRLRQGRVVTEFVALGVERGRRVQPIIPGSGHIECRYVGCLCVEGGGVAIMQLQPCDTTPFGQ